MRAGLLGSELFGFLQAPQRFALLAVKRHSLVRVPIPAPRRPFPRTGCCTSLLYRRRSLRSGTEPGDELDFDGDADRQLGKANRCAGMAPGLAEDLDQQVRAAV